MQYYVGLVFLLIVATILYSARARLVTFSALGVYSCSFLFMNYIGVYVLVFGGKDLQIHPFFFTEKGAVRALLIVNIGILLVWFGAFIAAKVFRRPVFHTETGFLATSRAIPVGVRIPVLLVLLFGAVSFMIALAMPLIGGFLQALYAGDPFAVLAYRREATGLDHYALRMIAYNILPYLALTVVLIYWRTGRFRFISWVTVVLAFWGLLYGFQKQPLIIFIFQLLIAYVVLGRATAGPWLKKSRWWQSLNIGTGIIVLCILLTSASGLYIFTRGFTSTGNWQRDMRTAIELSVSRLFLRTSGSYIYFGELIPDTIPFLGFRNVYSIQKILDEAQYFRINHILFLEIYPTRSQGNLASDSLANHYGQFGWWGLVSLSFAQGFMLSSIDRYFAIRPVTIGSIVLLLFMLRFSVYLNETHIYGALGGFGGAIFVFLGLIINKSCNFPSRKSDYRFRRAARPLGRAPLVSNHVILNR